MQMINKKTFFLICFVLGMILCSFSASAQEAMPEKVKIGLFYGSRSQNSYTVSSSGGMSVCLGDDEKNIALFTDKNLKEVVVKKNTFYSTESADVFDDYESAQVKIQEYAEQGYYSYCHYNGENFTVRIGLFDSIGTANESAALTGASTVDPAQTGIVILKGDSVLFSVDDKNLHLEIAPVSEHLAINSVAYRGNLRFIRKSANDLTAINILPLEEYLYAVLPKEVSPSWNEEALKAQAVTARTFTITNLNKFASYGFNLDNTTTSQVYGGVSVEHPRTTAAVDATKGEIVKYDSKPASVFYYSSSGGKTSNSEDVWTSALPYLRSVEDPYENPDEASYASWSVSFTKGRIKDALAKQNVNIGDIVDVCVEYSPSGRAIKLIITGTEGTKEYAKDSIRTPLGLRSTNFTLKKSGADASYFVIDSGKKNTAIDLKKNTAILSQDGIKTYEAQTPSFLSSKGIVTQAATSTGSDEYVFVGGGWGHGVGMSQWGAKGMADNGFTYKEILTHYFTGVQVETY